MYLKKTFFILGYHLFIRLYPETTSKNFIIQIIGKDEFKLPHQFSILSQLKTEHDIFSPILINCEKQINKIQVQCEGYNVTQEVLKSKKLIKNDILIVKLMIYL